MVEPKAACSAAASSFMMPTDERLPPFPTAHCRLGRRMRVILASPRGFCAGVNMAIETLELAIRLFGTPVYVYHEIVHNKYVVEHFRQRGAVFVDRLEEVPEGGHLLYSPHGVSPEIR